MKKFFAIALAVLAFSAAASAQSRTLGLRLGGDAELSYQITAGGNNFLEFDLGLGGYKNIVVSGVYDFIIVNDGGFNFYAGPGAQLGVFKYAKDDEKEGSHLGVGLGGQIGIEYNFNIPLTLSLDWRPMWDFLGYGASWSSAALGVRYRF
ncbi:MAG: hypothetical protein HUJ94_03210 [Bacteroidales bacterium]|nr:hypothetical protein [Bacteroidales bacterium]